MDLSRSGSFENATQLDENNVDAWEDLGVSYLKLKNYEEAKRCFEKAIKLDPKDEGTKTSLIELLIIKGDYGEAFEKARANVDLFESDKYRFLASFFATVSLALENRQEEFMEWLNKLLRYLQKAEKPWGISWNFSDIRPTLEQHLKKEDMSLISLLIDVFKEEKELVELEKELIKKR
jgi:tetratricopeptide (TPR) repeat protein